MLLFEYPPDRKPFVTVSIGKVIEKKKRTALHEKGVSIKKKKN